MKRSLFVPLALAACSSSAGKVAPSVDATADAIPGATADATAGVDRPGSDNDARDVAASADRPIAVDMIVADLMAPDLGMSDGGGSGTPLPAMTILYQGNCDGNLAQTCLFDTLHGFR